MITVKHDTEWCCRCRQYRPKSKFPKPQVKPAAYAKRARYCRQCRAEYAQERWNDLRDEIHGHLGNKCAACGSMDDLEVDHIDGDGGQDRQDRDTYQIWAWYLRRENVDYIQQDLQLLCHPCHKLKTRCCHRLVQESDRFQKLLEAWDGYKDSAILQWVLEERVKQLRAMLEMQALVDGITITWDSGMA